MSRFLKRVVTVGLLFGVCLACLLDDLTGPDVSRPVGVLAGVIFGILMATLDARLRVLYRGVPPCEPGECLLRDGPATHIRGGEEFGGWLWLTDRRLFFRPHFPDRHGAGRAIPLNTVLGTDRFSTAWVLPNGLLVRTREDAERFVVEGRRAWVGAIQGAAGSHIR